MFTIILNFGQYPLANKFKFFCIIIVLCYSTVSDFCYIMFTKKKFNKIDQNINKEKKERGVIASYLSVLTRFRAVGSKNKPVRPWPRPRLHPHNKPLPYE